MPTVQLNTNHFNLDVGGFAGFFGGEEAVSAMETVHLYRGRRWTGWFNSPGSYSVGKHYGQIASSRFWNGMFPGPANEPTSYLGLDGKPGPMYVASQSGTFLKQTGHLAYLLMQRCKDQQAVTVVGRRTKPNKVTILNAQDINFDTPQASNAEPSFVVHARDGFHKLVALFPIGTSIATCILCAWGDDWYCFSLILLGILANGISCFVIGSASIVLQSVAPSKNAPPGDGILMDGDHSIVVLGKEKNVIAITKGKFQLDYKPWARMRIRKERRNRGIVGDGIHDVHHWLGKKDAEGSAEVQNDEDAEINNEYGAIGLCSVLLVCQFLTQLLLIPQGTLFGQVMFLISFAVSWAYNLFLSSMDKEYLQEDQLIQALKLSEDHMKTYRLGTRTTAAVFACLALQPSCESGEWEKRGFRPQEILRQFIPNDTHVWAVWKDQVLEQMKSGTSALQSLDLESCGDRIAAFDDAERELLNVLLSDARTAFQQHLLLQARSRSLASSRSNSMKAEA
ncbi:hypothetical protein DEU56DRAFT_502899 [Suillus clintonianus]|uniref:uncharacterized protein n=1 Tax=Suillus clintonianus TaxID=1904413 RepID=UPI001B8612FC|nr:uncharacterized protein DEU56DRAFT_502899 [Suillus clintonianus]KAG2129010.1 hypothetical protein DEU56DRAFT_502899 [Suillus clintonianus]